MNMLFDVAPDEPQRERKRARAKEAANLRVISEPEKTPIIIGNTPARAILPIGTIDHTFPCIDQACQTECHDILFEEGGQWLIECAFCGTCQWVKALRGHLKPKEKGFVFSDGRFAGLTVEEAWLQPRGRDYVEWAAKSHKRQAVRGACQKFLDSQQSEH